MAMYYNIRIYMYDHDYDVDFHLMVMLPSTTDPYGQPVIEVTYEENNTFIPPRLCGR